MNTARELLDRARALGAHVTLTPAGTVWIEPAAVLDGTLLAELRAAKPEIVGLLRCAEEEPTLSAIAILCAGCDRFERGFLRRDGRNVCAACAEWIFTGCARFTVLNSADPQTQRECGACIACGAPWAMHEGAEASTWRRVFDADDVTLARVRFVLAAARDVIRTANRP